MDHLEVRPTVFPLGTPLTDRQIVDLGGLEVTD